MRIDNGSLARQIAEREQELLEQQRRQRIAQKRKKQERIKLQRRLRIRTILSICTLLSVAFLVVYGQVQQYEVQNQINGANDQLNEVLDEKNRAMVNIEKSKDLTTIQDKAQNELGMSKATSDQIVYLNLPEEDKVETSQKDKNILHNAWSKGESAMGSLSEKIRNIFHG